MLNKFCNFLEKLDKFVKDCRPITMGEIMAWQSRNVLSFIKEQENKKKKK